MSKLSLVALFAVSLFCRSISCAAAEPADAAKAGVLAVVQKFLDALAARDPARCRATLAPEGQMQVLNEDVKGAPVTCWLLGEFAERIAS